MLKIFTSEEQYFLVQEVQQIDVYIMTNNFIKNTFLNQRHEVNTHYLGKDSCYAFYLSLQII